MNRMHKVITGFSIGLLSGLLLLQSSIITDAATVQHGITVYDGMMVTQDPEDRDIIGFTTDYMVKGTDPSVQYGDVIYPNAGTLLKPIEAGVGQHLYGVDSAREITVLKWEAVWARPERLPQCIHEEYYDEDSYCGCPVESAGICFGEYLPGWYAYCSRCEGLVARMHFYMTDETAGSIKTLPGDATYYYICPNDNCHALEQGYHYIHKCKDISYNRYKVIYLQNTPAGAEVIGSMTATRHMYNNASLYNGKETDYTDTRLRPNQYKCEGYTFDGWALLDSDRNVVTDENGNPVNFADGAEVLNLTAENEGLVFLAAQWKEVNSTLEVDANGGTYDGAPVKSITQGFRSTYFVDDSLVVPPSGHTVTFVANGGVRSEMNDIMPSDGKAPDKVITEKELAGWDIDGTLFGTFHNRTYTFFSMTSGTKDRIVASYKDAPVTLPYMAKEGISFAGWYTDSAFTEYAGHGGDSFATDEDVTLYAKWVELELTVTDDYVSNNKKGAVDLSWKQLDNKIKFYNLYQSLDKTNWNQLYVTGIKEEEINIDEKFENYTVYPITYTGFYSLSAYGGAGASLGSQTGGYGGNVSAEYWLRTGDKILVYPGDNGLETAGGTNGNNADGGNSTTDKGAGGGAGSEVYLVRKKTDGTSETTLLMIAGGGGGANVKYPGGAGGATTVASVNNEEKSGSDGTYGGGGGGALGGKGGGEPGTGSDTTIDKEVVNHEHSAICGAMNCQSPNKDDDDHQHGLWCCPYYLGTNYTVEEDGTYIIEIWGGQGGGSDNSCAGQAYGGPGGYAKGTITLAAGDILSIDVGIKGNDRHSDQSTGDNETNEATGERGQSTIVTLTSSEHDGKSYNNYQIMEATGGYGGHSTCSHNPNGDWHTNGMGGTAYVDNTVGFEDIEIVDGKIEDGGVVISNATPGNTILQGKAGHGMIIITKVGVKPSEGGSSYINRNFGCRNEFLSAGVNNGTGYVEIKNKDVGYLEETHLDDVAAPDLAAPGKPVHKETLRHVNAGNSGAESVRVVWYEPQDYGTTYYHQAKSYYTNEFGIVVDLSVSDIEENTLTTGVAGYYYYIDTNSSGTVTKSHTKIVKTAGANTASVSNIPLLDVTQYLHVAAYDVAGNLGATENIPIEAKSATTPLPIIPEEVTAHTNQLYIKNPADGLYNPEANKYYVRADGETEFVMMGSGYINCIGNTERQNEYLTYHFESAGLSEWIRVNIPLCKDKNLIPTTTGTELKYTNDEMTAELSVQDFVFANPVSYMATRGTQLKNVITELRFTVDSDQHMKEQYIYPGTGLTYKGKEILSSNAYDRSNGITLIPDAKGPTITLNDAFREVMENDNKILDLTTDTITLSATASEAEGESGVKDIWVEVINLDNGSFSIIDKEVGATETFDVNSSSLYLGDVEFTIIAEDNVGNMTIIGSSARGFSLKAYLLRVRPPHTDENGNVVCKAGDGVILGVNSYGYAQEVEIIFPEGMDAFPTDSGYSNRRLYDFTDRDEPIKLLEEISVWFSIPSWMEDGEHFITVISRKKDPDTGTMRELTEILPFYIVEGKVFDEFRTRIIESSDGID